MFRCSKGILARWDRWYWGPDQNQPGRASSNSSLLSSVTHPLSARLPRARGNLKVCHNVIRQTHGTDRTSRRGERRSGEVAGDGVRWVGRQLVGFIDKALTKEAFGCM